MCAACITKVTPGLDATTSIQKWEVDTDNPQKTLTVEGENPSVSEIIENVKKAGYKIEVI